MNDQTFAPHGGQGCPTQARLFETIPTTAEQLADDREHELDRTPRGVVRQALERLLSFTHWPATGNGDHAFDRPEFWTVRVVGRLVKIVVADGPLLVLDWCAGSGVWSSELRAWCVRNGIPVRITAVELRECERANLERWADEVLAGADWTLALDPRTGGLDGHYDLAVGNPAFSLMISGLPLLLEHVNAAIVLHTTETLQRTEAGAELGRTRPPMLELGIPGSVRYRGQGTGADSRGYSVSAWVSGAPAGPGWTREILPLLPSQDRGWVEPPGGERVILPSWPTRPGWQP